MGGVSKKSKSSYAAGASRANRYAAGKCTVGPITRPKLSAIESLLANSFS